MLMTPMTQMTPMTPMMLMTSMTSMTPMTRMTQMTQMTIAALYNDSFHAFRGLTWDVCFTAILHDHAVYTWVLTRCMCCEKMEFPGDCSNRMNPDRQPSQYARCRTAETGHCWNTRPRDCSWKRLECISPQRCMTRTQARSTVGRDRGSNRNRKGG